MCQLADVPGGRGNRDDLVFLLGFVVIAISLLSLYCTKLNPQRPGGNERAISALPGCALVETKTELLGVVRTVYVAGLIPGPIPARYIPSRLARALLAAHAKDCRRLRCQIRRGEAQSSH